MSSLLIKKSRIFILFSSILFTSGILFSQPTYSLKNLDGNQNVTEWYDDQIEIENLKFITGTFEKPSRLYSDSSPYFNETLQYVDSELCYRGQVFTNVQAVYDIYIDVLFIKHPNLKYNNQPIKLNQSDIEWFKLDENLFRPFEGASGFYEVLFEGDSVSILKKVSKKLENIERDLFYRKVERYFFRIEKEFIPIKSYSAYYKQFPAYKKEIKNYIKSNRLKRFTIKSDVELSELTSYCDQLLNKIEL